MQKLLYKKFIFIPVFAICLFLLGHLCFNQMLSKSKPALVEHLEGLFHRTISLEKITYQFPNKLILKNLSIAESNEKKGARFFTAPQCDLKFVVLESLLKHNFVFKGVVIKKADFEPYPFYRFISFEVVEYFKHLDHHNFDMKIEQATYKWFHHGPSWMMQSQMSFKGDKLKSKGIIAKIAEKDKQKRIEDDPYSFNFNGSLANGGFTLTELIINQKDFSSKLWGHLVDDLLWLNGYCVRTNLFQGTVKNETKSFLSTWVEYFPQSNTKKIKKKILENGTVYLSDMGVLAQLDKGGAKIQRLFFILNGVPIVIGGNINWQSQAYQLKLDVNWAQTKGYAGKIQKVNALIKGGFGEATFNTDSEINLFWKTGEKSNQVLSRVGINVDDFKFNFLSYPKCYFTLKEGRINFQDLSADISVPLKESEGYINLSNRGLPQGRVQSHLYDGLFSARLNMNLLNSPLMTTRLRLKNIQLVELTENIFNLSKLNGLLDGELMISNKPSLSAKGKINVKNAELTDEHLIKQISEYFQLSHKQLIAFDRVSSLITYDGKEVKLPNVKLDMENLKLRGSLVLKDDISVNSRFSLYLTREFIQNSKYLRPTLSVFGRQDPVRFDFKVSGYASSLNFQWADSDSKKQIQTRLPDFIERIVEERIQRSYNQTSIN